MEADVSYSIGITMCRFQPEYVTTGHLQHPVKAVSRQGPPWLQGYACSTCCMLLSSCAINTV